VVAVVELEYGGKGLVDSLVVVLAAAAVVDRLAVAVVTAGKLDPLDKVVMV
jgi:hypothetical protein